MILIKDLGMFNGRRRALAECPQCHEIQNMLMQGVSKANKCMKCMNKHGMSHDKLYRAWKSMRNRCNNPNDKRYHRYGARGIKVCEEWNDSNNFILWAKTHGYKEGLSIERIDIDKDYEPSNCKWIPFKDQALNTVRSMKYTEDEWSDALEMKDALKFTIPQLSKIMKVSISSIIRIRGDKYHVTNGIVYNSPKKRSCPGFHT